MTGWMHYRWSRPVHVVYGTTVVYRDDVVYVDGKKVASADDYYQQANDLANAVPKVDESQAEKIEWLPLGFFAYMSKGVSETNSYLQLAVSKDGTIGGTYFNATTNTSRPTEGTADKKTQRAAWRFADGKKTDSVMETSIYNLTKDKASVLVHFGAAKTQEDELVRMEAPKEGDKPPGTHTTPKDSAADKDKEAAGWYQLAENYLAAGMRTKAADSVNRILKKYPESEWAEKGRKLLAN